jgi:hypothetical protein
MMDGPPECKKIQLTWPHRQPNLRIAFHSKTIYLINVVVVKMSKCVYKCHSASEQYWVWQRCEKNAPILHKHSKTTFNPNTMLGVIKIMSISGSVLLVSRIITMMLPYIVCSIMHCCQKEKSLPPSSPPFWSSP